MFWVGYIAVGFLIASAFVRFCDAFEPGDENALRVFMFMLFTAFWPAIAVHWALRIPYLLLVKYINHLSK